MHSNLTHLLVRDIYNFKQINNKRRWQCLCKIKFSALRQYSTMSTHGHTVQRKMLEMQCNLQCICEICIAFIVIGINVICSAFIWWRVWWCFTKVLWRSSALQFPVHYSAMCIAIYTSALPDVGQGKMQGCLHVASCRREMEGKIICKHLVKQPHRHCH